MEVRVRGIGVIGRGLSLFYEFAFLIGQFVEVSNLNDGF